MRTTKSYLTVFLLILAGVFILAACNTAGDTTPQAATQPESEMVVAEKDAAAKPESEDRANEPEAESVSSDEQPTETSQQAEPTETETPSEVEEAQEPEVADTDEDASPPNRGSTLEATDPATVSLASGGIQLVEFFAFW